MTGQTIKPARKWWNGHYLGEIEYHLKEAAEHLAAARWYHDRGLARQDRLARQAARQALAAGRPGPGAHDRAGRPPSGPQAGPGAGPGPGPGYPRGKNRDHKAIQEGRD